MLNPSPAELLLGVADALRAAVVPNLEAGDVREQVVAAAGIVARVARCLSGFGPYLHADIVDMASVLKSAGVDIAAGVEIGTLPEAIPPLDELIALDLHLRSLVTQLDQQHPELPGLLARLTEREVALRLSPWER